jgi:hypothetical protein
MRLRQKSVKQKEFSFSISFTVRLPPPPPPPPKKVANTAFYWQQNSNKLAEVYRTVNYLFLCHFSVFLHSVKDHMTWSCLHGPAAQH